MGKVIQFPGTRQYNGVTISAQYQKKLIEHEQMLLDQLKEITDQADRVNRQAEIMLELYEKEYE